MTIYDLSLIDNKGNEVSLSEFKGKVMLIVNTATKCGFTPQLKELEEFHKKYNSKGLKIIDIPCNQFGNQAPESDEEIATFCELNFGTSYRQFQKSDVNGENEIPLYTYLKSQKGFEAKGIFNTVEKLKNRLLLKDPEFENKSDIKWNFTKFLVDRDGNVVKRFEPLESMKKVEESIVELLG